jgi:putative iron-dependent peroxidase
LKKFEALFMNNTQPGILAPVPRLARYLTFSLKPDSDPKKALMDLRELADGDKVVVGIGKSLALALGVDIAGLRNFPNEMGAGIEIPSTPASLWCWLRGKDRGELVHQSRLIHGSLASGFHLNNVIDAFQYGPSLDLTGYEDGTENPKGDDAIEAGIVKGAGKGLDGSSFVAVQQWVHDLDQFQSMSVEKQDNTIGRRKSDNEELDDAPLSAHVKRTAQESFQPEAFILRRSMPWADANHEGLVFVAFGKRFDAFEALLRRMVGGEDGVTDALFSFTRPISGSYFWCPPMDNGGLDLRVLEL